MHCQRIGDPILNQNETDRANGKRPRRQCGKRKQIKERVLRWGGALPPRWSFHAAQGLIVAGENPPNLRPPPPFAFHHSPDCSITPPLFFATPSDTHPS